MKQVRNKARIKSTVNVCFRHAKTDRVKDRKKLINAMFSLYV
jgi:hypothetical protein